MNKEELVKAVADKTKLSQKQTAEVVASILETVQKTVAKGKKVTLVGFGTFEARKRAARVAVYAKNKICDKILKLADNKEIQQLTKKSRLKKNLSMKKSEQRK